MLITTGPDGSPTVIPLGQFGFENQRALPFLSHDPMIRTAPKERLMMSWWERQVHIWRVSKTTKVTSKKDSEDEPPNQGRKLVAKIFIKGDESITSADISADGNILAISTTSDIKLFHLRSRNSSQGDTLRVTKLPNSSTLSCGARLLQFSPDSKWLCIIQPDNNLTIARFLISTSSSPTVHPQLARITRLDRHTEKYITLGGLGSYERSITQVAFSADSKILAVSDLAGYIDSFILSGVEDLLSPIPNYGVSAASSSGSKSEYESESEAEDEVVATGKAKGRLMCGQQWTRNPLASSIPKLNSAPVLLSFRPSSLAPSTKSLTNGTTPNNPSLSEDRLLIVTSTSEVFEISVLQGNLTSWSRRNPTSSFPDKFQKTLETVKGCVWDVSIGKERVWLYSVGWLWMFDLSRDFPTSSTLEGEEDLTKKVMEGSKKRKRNGRSGAGGKTSEKKSQTGISREVRHFVNEESDKVVELVPSMDVMDVDNSDGDEEALERMRRGSVIGGEEGDGNGKKPHHWQTFKYRPIMGVVVIGERVGDEEGDTGPEVAIVERPIWEVDLPPRFYGDQEWKEKEIDVTST